jgi:hypothetical protein
VLLEPLSMEPGALWFGMAVDRKRVRSAGRSGLNAEKWILLRAGRR